MESGLFKRTHHQRIARILESLNGELFAQHACWFGGGTAIALLHGEFRQSVDIDFLCSSIEGFREIRGTVSSSGLTGLAKGAVSVLREPKMDQYGIRSALAIDGVAVKLEIVLEARVKFESPREDDVVCGMKTLTTGDLVTSKLLANSDRWADDGVMSRDLIDLAALVPDGCLPLAAVVKAEAAYGPSIRGDLARAIARLLEREGRLRRCIAAMEVDIPEHALRARIAALGLPPHPCTAAAKTGNAPKGARP